VKPKIGRNDPCPCGSGKKYKKCHGSNGSVPARSEGKTLEQKSATSANLPLAKLGLPGASYQLVVQARKRGQPPTPPSVAVVLRDKYRVVLTLTRAITETQSLKFESALVGDSFARFAKAKSERTDSDIDEMVIFYGHGIQRIELKGLANEHGRLSKVSVETVAGSFSEAETIAYQAATPFLSSLSFELDIPLRIAQMDVTQLSTQNASMTYTCPYTDVVPPGGEFYNVPYIQSLLSLYREGINSHSPNYQFLCWYKIVEGINVKRQEETEKLKAPLALKYPERFEKSPGEQRKRLEEAFPFIKACGATDSAWDDLVPDEVRNWKFNRVREKKLEPLRNKIAHMISEASGDLSLSPDSRENAREVTKWISLLRYIARVMTMNEAARIPKPPPIFNIPQNAIHVDQLRRATNVVAKG
jgi:SEC-C motif